MKYTTALTVCSFLVANAEEVSTVQQDQPRPKLLQEVYGSPDKLLKSPVKMNRSIRRPEYYAARSSGNCTFPLDVVILQDNTGSFSDDYEQMRKVQLQLMTDALAVEHPGSRFSVVPFRDKPVGTLGEAFDYCHRYDLPLSDVGFEKLDEVYANLWSNGGKDPAENQFGAMIAALESKEVGWGGADSTATKLIVLSTDAWPHFAADGLNVYGMKSFSGHIEEDEEAQCVEQYYPSPQQVQSAIADAGAYVAFLVFDGNYAGGQVLSSWKWFNSYIGQPDEFLEPLANDSSNFWDLLSIVIQRIEEQQCVESAPVSSTTTTTTTTTATTQTTTTSPDRVDSDSTGVPNTEIIVTPVASTQTPPTEECEGQDCPCPEVVIELRHKPARMSLVVENTD